MALPVQDGREHLWAKVRGAFKYAYEKYKDEVDWFMKADDDTYVQKTYPRPQKMIQNHREKQKHSFASKVSLKSLRFI